METAPPAVKEDLEAREGENDDDEDKKERRITAEHGARTARLPRREGA